jgi:hypothetical protein
MFGWQQSSIGLNYFANSPSGNKSVYAMTFGQMFFCQMFFDQMTWNTAHLSEAMQTFQEISAQWYKLLQKNVCTGIFAVM